MCASCRLTCVLRCMCVSSTPCVRPPILACVLPACATNGRLCILPACATNGRICVLPACATNGRICVLHACVCVLSPCVCVLHACATNGRICVLHAYVCVLRLMGASSSPCMRPACLSTQRTVSRLPHAEHASRSPFPHVCMTTRPYSLHAFSQSRISASSACNAARAASRSLAGGMTVLRQTSTICTSSGFSSLRAM